MGDRTYCRLTILGFVPRKVRDDLAEAIVDRFDASFELIDGTFDFEEVNDGTMDEDLSGLL